VVVDGTHTKTSKYESATDNTAAPADASLSTPKQYVREREMAGDGTGQGAGTGGGQVGTKGGDEIIQRYEQTISMWIQTRKIYPQDAQGRVLEGNTTVRVRIDHEGHILFYQIEVSSGNSQIDAAALEMVRRSNPVPPVPNNYPDNQLEFLIPVNFTLH
jgi:protein TonB